MFFMFGSRFQNWDLRIRPQRGNFTDSLDFKSKIVNSDVQRSQIKKIDPRCVEVCFVCYIYFLGRRKASAAIGALLATFWTLSEHPGESRTSPSVLLLGSWPISSAPGTDPGWYQDGGTKMCSMLSPVYAKQIIVAKKTFRKLSGQTTTV